MHRIIWTAMGALLGAPLGLATAQDLVVYRLSLRNTIDTEVSRVLDRAVVAAERRGAALILDLAAIGGDRELAVRAAQNLRDASVAVHALVCGRTLGVGTLLVLAVDSVFFCPDAALGGAHEVQPDQRQAYGNDLSRLMTARTLDPELGYAMADASVRLPGITSSSEPLVLDADLAMHVGLAVATVSGFDSVLSILGLENAYVIDADRDWNNTRAEVSNYNWLDVRVFVVRGGTRIRLGTVTSMNSADYEIPAGHLAVGSQIQLLAEPIGSSERFMTQRVRVEPGLVLLLDVANVIQQSSFSYYRRN